MTQVIIADLDGTISFDHHRTHYLKQEPKDWNAYYLACDKDEPNKAVISVLQDAFDTDIYIFSGRSDIARDKTIMWLRNHNVPYDFLFMREDGDFTPDYELKYKWLCHTGIQDRVLFVLEDRDQVVKMWREHNITCFQVAPGEF